MKLAILFCVVAFACAVQASPTNVSRADEVKNRGTIAETIKEKLRLVIDSLIEKASDILKLADDLTEKLKAGALKATKKINDPLQKILDKFNSSVRELEQSANAEGVDVSECSKLPQTMRQSIMAMMANNSACIIQKIEAGQELIADLTRISKETIAELGQVKQDGGACLKNIDGIRSTVSATACVGKTTAKASWIVTKKTPFIAWDLTKITILLSTLQATLSSCMTENSALTIAQETTTVLGSFKKCVMQKISKEGVGAN